MITYKQRGLTIADVWFTAAHAPSSGVDVVHIRRSLDPIPGMSNEEFHTILLDLSSEQAALWNSLSKENRYEIRRAENKDQLTFEILTEPTLVDYEEFAIYFAHFAKQKSLPEIGDTLHGIMRQYVGNRNVVLSNVLQEGKILVRHAYYAQDNRCRLLYSASLFRDSNDSSFRSLVGRANRFLHWNDILFFRTHGFTAYDWGGWHAGSNPELLRINDFKESFGGSVAKVYDVRYGLTLLGRIESIAVQWAHERRKHARSKQEVARK